jgi:hypothetical protein
MTLIIFDLVWSGIRRATTIVRTLTKIGTSRKILLTILEEGKFSTTTKRTTITEEHRIGEGKFLPPNFRSPRPGLNQHFLCQCRKEFRLNRLRCKRL